MSKTFDEGGAKGLLLVNLGTGGNGCNIVFDSNLADDDDNEKVEDGNEGTGPADMTVDVSSLTAELDSLLSGQSIHSLPLVPQLAGLRAEFSNLEEEGFVDHKEAPVSRKRRFAPDPDEEKEAERSIHQEVLERSRVSMGRSFVADEDETRTQADTQHEYADDDYGGFDDGDDDNFDAFIAADDSGHRFSSLSFGGDQVVSQGASQTTVLLDAIESGQVLGESEYVFFDSQELSHVASNAWAGSAHWKPLAHLHKPKVTKEPKTTEKKASRRKACKERVFVDLSQDPDLSDILRKPPKVKKGRKAVDPLQFTSASITKYTKNENLLPPDACIRPSALSSLFLRPNAMVKPDAAPSNTKTVGFAMDQVETYGGDDWDDGSFGGGDDDDGPGFAMTDSGDNDDGDNDFVVDELDGVRKVEKVTVGYATIAKKVDVKRLKRDLWTEVESHLKLDKQDEVVEEQEDNEEEEKEEFPTTPTAADLSGPLTFQKTVQAMEASKTQVDVTLPFYFICILHLANEKGLRLDSKSLEDFEIHSGEGGGSFF